jgi:hypothetical protein
MNLAIVGDTPLLERASSLLSTLCGESFLPIPGPLAFQIIFGIVSMFLVFFGIFLLTRKHAGPRIFVLVSYAAGLALIHTTWKWSDIRYLIPFVPLIWILIIAALSKLLHRYRTLQGLLLAISIALSLRTGLVHARAGLHGGAQFQPRTIAWIKENVPATARMASTMKYSIGLLAQRECAGQGLAQDPELWLTAARFHRVEYLHVVLPRPGDEFGLNGFPDNYQFAFARWLETRPEATRLYQNPGEGSLIYRLDRL